MRGRAVVILVGMAASAVYFLGSQDAASDRAANVSPPKPIAMPVLPAVANPRPIVAASPAGLSSESKEARRPSNKVQLASDSQEPNFADQVPKTDAKRKVEVALTAAAIVAILIQASRDQYHATGRPCACPDDRMRNGSACGGRSAHSRPGGAAPLCYAADVTPAMIEAYRKAIVSR